MLRDGASRQCPRDCTLLFQCLLTAVRNPNGVRARTILFTKKGTGLVDTTELRSVIGNLGERFSSEEIGQMMLMSEINSEGKMSITDLIAFCSKYK